MLVLILLLVHEWRGEKESYVRLFVLLVEHRADLTNITVIYLNDIELF